MKTSETAKILAIITTAYPEKFQVDDTKIKLWGTLLKDFSYEIVNIAVQKHITTSPYVPAISDIRNQVIDIITPEEEKIDAGEAWGEVVRAISLYGTYRQEEAKQTLSPKVLQVIRYMGWQAICHTENIDVVRGQFVKIYNSVTQRERQLNLVPKELMLQINNINGSINIINSGMNDILATRETES
jgi:hypothetical protein